MAVLRDEIGQQIGRAIDAGAGIREGVSDVVDRLFDRILRAGDGVFGEQQDAPVAGLAARRLGERDIGEYVEFGGEVVRVARHRADYRQGDAGEIGAREIMAVRVERGVARLVAPDAAKGGGHADRAADVRADFDRHVAGGERRCCAARRAAADAIMVVRVAGAAVIGVVGLQIGEADGDVGLAEDYRAGGLHALDGDRVGLGDMVGVFGEAPAGGEAGDVEAFLDRHGYAEERASLIFFGIGAGVVERLGGSAGTVEIADDDGVDLAVAGFDARDRGFGLGERGSFTGTDRGGGGEGGAGHFNLPSSPRKRGPISRTDVLGANLGSWVPAFAGMTIRIFMT